MWSFCSGGLTNLSSGFLGTAATQKRLFFSSVKHILVVDGTSSRGWPMAASRAATLH